MWNAFTVRIILNGLLVKIGCQHIYFPDAIAMASALEDYIKNPDATVLAWRSTRFAKLADGPANPQPLAPRDVPISFEPSCGPEDQAVSSVLNDHTEEIRVSPPPPPDVRPTLANPNYLRR